MTSLGEAAAKGRDGAPDRSCRVIVAAVLGNVAIAIAKSVAAAVTGSSSMLAEAVHSFVDTGDGLLLHLGVRSSRRRPDGEHPLGYGKDLYFFSLVVSMVVFGVGGGVTLYEGVTRLLHPRPIEHTVVSYAVLGIAAVCEGLSLRVAAREFLAYRRERLRDVPMRRAFVLAKDPSMFAVVLEDAAALTGIAIASLGLLLAQLTGQVAFDACGSIGVGLLLAAVAIFLAGESRGLLIGEPALPWVDRGVRELVERDPAVEAVIASTTEQIGAGAVLVRLELHFRPELTRDELEAAIVRMTSSARSRFGGVRRVFFDARSFGAA